MAEIGPVDLEAALVVEMHELVTHGALEVAATVKVVGAQNDGAAPGDVSACHDARARGADEVALGHLAPAQAEVVQQKGDRRRVGEQPLLVHLAALHSPLIALPHRLCVARRDHLGGPLPPTLKAVAHQREERKLRTATRSLFIIIIMGRLRRSRAHHARRDVHRASRTRVLLFLPICALLTVNRSGQEIWTRSS